jgi:hypothetical protein
MTEQLSLVKSSAMYFLDHNLNNGDHQFHQYPIDDKNNASKYSCSTEGKPTESTPGFSGVPVSQFSVFCDFVL